MYMNIFKAKVENKEIKSLTAVVTYIQHDDDITPYLTDEGYYLFVTINGSLELPILFYYDGKKLFSCRGKGIRVPDHWFDMVVTYPTTEYYNVVEKIEDFNLVCRLFNALDDFLDVEVVNIYRNITCDENLLLKNKELIDG